MKPLLLKTTHPQTLLSYRYAVLSVAVVLYLMGWVVLLWIGSQQLRHQWQEAVPFSVEMIDTATESQIFQYQKTLETRAYTQAGTVHYISKEEGVKQLQADLGRDSLLLFGENPLPNLLQFQLKSGYFGQVDSITAELKRDELVAQVFFDAGLVEMAERLGAWSWALLLLAIALGVGAVLLVRHALLWTIWANRSTLKIMQLVGARPATLVYPYRRQALFNGLWSGGIASLLVLATAIALNTALGGIFQWAQNLGFWLLLCALPLLGVALWQVSLRSYAARYLLRHPDDWN